MKEFFVIIEFRANPIENLKVVKQGTGVHAHGGILLDTMKSH